MYDTHIFEASPSACPKISFFEAKCFQIHYIFARNFKLRLIVAVFEFLLMTKASKFLYDQTAMPHPYVVLSKISYFWSN